MFTRSTLLRKTFSGALLRNPLQLLTPSQIFIQQSQFSYQTTNSNPTKQEESEQIDKIANSRYVLVEEPVVEVLDPHTDDMLFEILTRCRTVDNLVELYKLKSESMSNFHNSVLLTRFVKLLKAEEAALIQEGEDPEVVLRSKDKQAMYESITTTLF